VGQAENHHHHHVSGRKLLAAVLLNFAITAAEAAGGLISGSLALLSDAIHNFSDGISLIISYSAIRLGGRNQTLGKTFGFKRAEILAALFNAALMVIVVFFLFREAYHRLASPVAIKAGLMMGVAGLGLVANLAAVLLLHREAGSSLNIRSSYLHLVADTVSSAGVIAGGAVILLTGFSLVDPLITVAIGLYVLVESYQILRQAANILMQSTPEHIDIMAIKGAVEAVPGVSNLHHVHVWQLNEKEVNFEGHIDVCEDLRISEVGELQRKVEELLKEKFGINHVTLQVEYGVCTDKKIIREC
jgi:cobalt-zinc-cadmium efflux system protein